MRQTRRWLSSAALTAVLLATTACGSGGSGHDGSADSGAAGARGGAGGTSGSGGGGGGAAGSDAGGVACGPTTCAPGQICMPSDCTGPVVPCFAIPDGGCPLGTTQVTQCLGMSPACESNGCWEQPPPRCVSP